MNNIHNNMPVDRLIDMLLLMMSTDTKAAWKTSPAFMMLLLDLIKRTPVKDFSLFGYEPDENDLNLEESSVVILNRMQLAAVEPATAAPLFSAIDLRNKNGHNYVTPIKFQDVSGACVAFSVTATMEIQARLHQDIPVDAPDQQLLPELSEAHLFICSTDHGMWGWNIPAALEFVKNFGVVPERCFPYRLEQILRGDCALCDDWESQVTTVASYSTISGDTPAGVVEMKNWLATSGPLIAIVDIYPDILWYGSGVYVPTIDLKLGRHSVCCIGYDDERQAWLCKNSWGTSWGEAGFGWIRYGACGIDARMWKIDEFQTIYQEPSE